MSNIEVDNLLVALDNESNHSILNLTSEKIDSIKTNILRDLGIPETLVEKFKLSLKGYMYVDEIPDLTIGAFIRWIPLKASDNIKLTRGGYICDITICKEGIMILLKNHFNKYFQVLLNSCLVFRKLNNEEKILLAAMNYLHK